MKKSTDTTASSSSVDIHTALRIIITSADRDAIEMQGKIKQSERYGKPKEEIVNIEKWR